MAQKSADLVVAQYFANNDDHDHDDESHKEEDTGHEQYAPGSGERLPVRVWLRLVHRAISTGCREPSRRENVAVCTTPPPNERGCTQGAGVDWISAPSTARGDTLANRSTVWCDLGQEGRALNNITYLQLRHQCISTEIPIVRSGLTTVSASSSARQSSWPQLGHGKIGPGISHLHASPVMPGY